MPAKAVTPTSANDASATVPRPTPPTPIGLSIQPKSALSIGPGARALVTAATLPAPAAIQTTLRHPAPGGAPVGNRSGTRPSSRRNAGMNVQVANQAT